MTPEIQKAGIAARNKFTARNEALKRERWQREEEGEIDEEEQALDEELKDEEDREAAGTDDEYLGDKPDEEEGEPEAERPLTNEEKAAKLIAEYEAEQAGEQATEAPEAEAPAAETAAATVRMSGNTAEIRFPSKPSAEIRKQVREAGFTWRKEQKVWTRDLGGTHPSARERLLADMRTVVGETPAANGDPEVYRAAVGNWLDRGGRAHAMPDHTRFGLTFQEAARIRQDVIAKRGPEAEKAAGYPPGTVVKPSTHPTQQPATTWMNTSEIEEAVQRFEKHPILGPAARFLQAFQEEVDRHSDGWLLETAGPRGGQLQGLIHARARE